MLRFSEMVFGQVTKCGRGAGVAAGLLSAPAIIAAAAEVLQ